MQKDTDPDCDYAGDHSYPSPKGKEPMRPYHWHSESNENRQLIVPVVAKKYNDDDEAGDADRDAFLEVDSEDDGDIPTTDGGSFNLDFIFQRMNEISLEEIDKMNQLDHDKAIRDLIDGNLSSVEENSLFLSAKRIEGGLKHVPKNHDVEHAIANDPEIRQSIERYRKHGGDILRNLTELMLAAGSRNNVPVETQGWLLLLMANATKNCRERIIAALTNPSINPACIQFASGQQSWGPDMFDTAPKINLADPSACGDAVTAYMIIGLLSGRRFAYSGSATNTNAAQKDIGETSRMKVHSRILGLGHEEVLRRRRVGDTRVFKVHELLSKMEDHDYSFFPTVRIPVDVTHPDHLVSATLVLLAEIINMVLFDTRSSDPVPRKGRAMVFIDQTNRLMKRLRPKDCPVAPWEGMNRVIPVLQMPKAVWGLLRQGQQQSSLPQLMSRLREHFKKTRSLSLDRSLGAEMLKSVDRPSDEKNVRIVRRMYATILNENELAYKSVYQEFLYMRCVLWHSIIVVAEKGGLVSFQDGKYHLETSALDWVEVSRVARSIAPDALVKSFSRTKCLELYRDRESAYFNQQVVFPMVWGKLRDGVPTKYAYAKARHYLPSPIRNRIRDICKYMLMQHDNSIDHGETVVRTDEKHPFQARGGSRRNMGGHRVLGLCLRTCQTCPQRPSKGISPEEANDWGNLKVLQPSWVLTSAQGPDVEYLPESVIAEAVDPMLLPALSDTPKHIIERMTFLQHKQAEFEPFSNAENRLGPRSGPGLEGTTEPFDLGDGRGITLRTRTSSESEEETSGVEQTTSKSDVSSAIRTQRPVSEGLRILSNASLAQLREGSVQVSLKKATSTQTKPESTARDAGGPSYCPIWSNMCQLVKADAAVV
ncbi:hypothetical protein FIE12Z_8666 [Fusarium flagelliforme]|uniref:Uncharacterized protein n=1 Tax=Fusarium flagelliforme TaxID=2675880 RepID=A0A395MGR0_9HYPO|nr:hypothetical protein FIE12Z_8666 [Fusarium flagelliforme]